MSKVLKLSCGHSREENPLYETQQGLKVGVLYRCKECRDARSVVEIIKSE